VRSRWVSALILVALFVPATPAHAAEEPTYLNEFFESGTDVFNSTAWGMQDLGNGHLGKGLKSVMKTGAHWGASGWWYFESHGLAQPDELYWRYWLRFDDDFYIEPPARGKLPGPATLGGSGCKGGVPTTTTHPCFSARMLFSRVYGESRSIGPDGVTLIGSYVYHLDEAGDIQTWDRDVASLDNGKWYCVEGRIKLNTPGKHDGVIEGWVDGQQAYSRSDFAFRRADEGSMHIKSFWFDNYYGGSYTSPVVNEVDFDSLALGDQKIGCEEYYKGSFFDDDDNIFENDIEWMADSGITKGCNPPTNNMYCPDNRVTRDVMAVYLARALNLPTASKDYFDDDDGSQFEDDINRMAKAGITKGCGDRMFCPRDTVDRGQMAAFLVRALGLTDNGGGNLFTDDDNSIFEKDIDKLGTAGVTKGCNPPSNTLYCPDQGVDRGAMAAFIHRAVGD
jgi:hypothetical protein